MKRNSHIIESSQPDIVLHDSPAEELDTLHKELNTDTKIICVTEIIENQTEPPNSTWNNHRMGGLLQFTSGSTAKPKPIYLDGVKIAINCAAIKKAYSLNKQSVGVHWLPLFHDMGLVGSCIASMWTGCLSVLLRPTVFIQRPRAWLEHISYWKGTITSAPNFAYEQLCQRIQTCDINGLNLSSLTSVVIGGEPVSKETLTKLIEKFGPCGLNLDSLSPSYGMAEATLLISSGRRIAGPIYSSSHSDFPVTGLGAPIDGVKITLRDKQTLKPVANGQLGEIWISGKGVGQVIPLDKNWRIHKGGDEVCTGDYGFFEEGVLFLTGRDANKIIIRGRNVFAEDIEFLVKQSQPTSFCAGVAALGIEDNGSQNLCILIEDNRTQQALNIRALNEVILNKIGVKPSQVVLLKRATLPRTSSGKIQRNLAKKQYINHEYINRVV
jgi:acyl-CoA synthetase (AMP-forming)/AMP-acid ligase II